MKTANILFSVGLEQRLGSKGVYASAIHPGVISTELARHMEPEDFEFMQARAAELGENTGAVGKGGLPLKSVEAGAATHVYAATAPELEGRGGLYMEDCHVAAVNDAENASECVRSYALDPASTDRLWTISEELVSEQFSF